MGTAGHEPFRNLLSDAKSILSPTRGFIARAGLTHFLNPARNCTFGYCCVPTMRVQAGLKPGDWLNGGQLTTVKQNAPELLARGNSASQVIYCSPLVDPYQPAERALTVMPQLLTVLLGFRPSVFEVLTRGALILRDLDLLKRLSERTALRVSFSITTNSGEVRRWYEPLCDPTNERLEAVRKLRSAGVESHVTVAPILPCDPERLISMVIDSSASDIIADPFHVRSAKTHGAVTRPAANRVSGKRRFLSWHDPGYMAGVVDRMKAAAAAHGYRFGVGPEAFGWLARIRG